jgi:hypothetical protein
MKSHCHRLGSHVKIRSRAMSYSFARSGSPVRHVDGARRAPGAFLTLGAFLKSFSGAIVSECNPLIR